MVRRIDIKSIDNKEDSRVSLRELDLIKSSKLSCIVVRDSDSTNRWYQDKTVPLTIVLSVDHREKKFFDSESKWDGRSGFRLRNLVLDLDSEKVKCWDVDVPRKLIRD